MIEIEYTWERHSEDRMSCTYRGADYLTANAPVREGWKPYFTAKHTGYVVWTYKR